MRPLSSALIALAFLSGLIAAPLCAQDRVTLGWGRLLTNDYIGDGQDRWRSSSYTLNWLRGPDGLTDLPDRPGTLIEHRFRAEIIAPRNLNGAGSDDRAYAGVLSYGLHTQFRRNRAELSLGVDLVAIGPQTGIADLQNWFHDQIGQPLLSDSVLADQVPNSLWLSPVAEVGLPVQLGRFATLRPFVEVQAGVEELVRIGADLTLGTVGEGALTSRDSTTGQLIRTVHAPGFGWSFIAGADAALVGGSAYFPAGFGTDPTDTRTRLRLGAHWQADERVTFFYGATWLSPEFVGQPEGQVLGSVKLNFNF